MTGNVANTCDHCEPAAPLFLHTDDSRADS
jgi:hypothetical protein